MKMEYVELSLGSSLMNSKEFWQVKQETDDIVKRLGWSKEYCQKYILAHYGKRSRRVMTDEQLGHLLFTLRKMKPKQRTQKLLNKKKRLGMLGHLKKT